MISTRKRLAFRCILSFSCIWVMALSADLVLTLLPTWRWSELCHETTTSRVDAVTELGDVNLKLFRNFVCHIWGIPVVCSDTGYINQRRGKNCSTCSAKQEPPHFRDVPTHANFNMFVRSNNKNDRNNLEQTGRIWHYSFNYAQLLQIWVYVTLIRISSSLSGRFISKSEHQPEIRVRT